MICFMFFLRWAQEAPKRPQERQEAAKRRQDSAEKRQVSAKRCQDAPKSDLAAIWARSGTLRGGPKPSKTIKKTRVFKVFVFFQRRRKKSPKELPKEAPGRRKWLPGAPRERPGATQEAPRQRQERPSATQERPKSRPRGQEKGQKRIQSSISLFRGGQGGQNAPQERPGRGQERPKRRQDGPRSRQKRPRSTPRAAQEAKKRNKKGYHLRFRSWGGSGRPPGAILKRFGSDFRASGVAF